MFVIKRSQNITYQNLWIPTRASKKIYSFNVFIRYKVKAKKISD